MKQQRFSLVLVALLVGIISGCVTAPKTAVSPAARSLSESEGVVVLSVVGNTAQIQQFESLTLRRLQDHWKTPYIVNRIANGLARDTTLYSGVLPDGEYRFDRFTDTTTQKYLALNDKAVELLGRFEVRAGHTSDLGAIVISPVGSGFTIGTGRSDIRTSNKPLISRFVADQLAIYERPTIAGWREARHEKDNIEAYAVRHPRGVTDLKEMADGTVVTGSRMGGVMLRSTEGKWTTKNTGDLKTVLTLDPEADGNVVVAGEFNSLFRMSPAGVFTALDVGDMPAGNIIFIDQDPNGRAYVWLDTTGKAQLLYSDSLNAGEWKLLAEVNVKTSLWSGPKPLWVWSNENELVYASYKGGVRRLDFETSEWGSHPAPGGRALSSLIVGVDGVLGALTSPGGGFGGVFAKLHVSENSGETWSDLTVPYKVKIVAPAALGDNRLETAGGFKRKRYVSDDMGASWEKEDARFGLDVRYWPTQDSGVFRLSVNGYDFESLENSTDNGKTWTAEKAQGDIVEELMSLIAAKKLLEKKGAEKQ